MLRFEVGDFGTEDGPDAEVLRGSSLETKTKTAMRKMGSIPYKAP